MFYTKRIPNWFTRLNPNLVWKGDTTGKKLYLSFDDGPHETATPFVLDQLKKYDAKASFFCLGKNVQAHPAIYARMVDEGHTPGNHTFSHPNGWKTDNSVYLADVAAAAQYIDSRLFRPPYGRVSPMVSRLLRTRLGYTIIMWHVLSGDFDTRISPRQCLENVVLNAAPGSIIVFHDSAKAWERLQYALPAVLEHYAGLGYAFEALQ